MIEYRDNGETAMIVLHEIYGVNRFIEDICIQYNKDGFDVFCPNLSDTNVSFSYNESSRAYSYFRKKTGFDVFKKITSLITRLKNTYKKVFITGFSIGATVAWRCSADSICDATICCYGSRIRDYLPLQPQCPTLLMFAEHDSFDVDNVIKKLQKRPNVEIIRINAHHGFLDKYSEHYDSRQTHKFNALRKDFLATYTK